MKMLTLPVLTMAVLTVSCSEKSAQGPLTVALSFAPSPPAKGPETLTVTVKDGNGDPVTGAAVRITTNMPMMSMAGPNLMLKDQGAGTYAVRTNLQYATNWVFDVTATANGETGTARITQTVK